MKLFEFTIRIHVCGGAHFRFLLFAFSFSRLVSYVTIMLSRLAVDILVEDFRNF